MCLDQKDTLFYSVFLDGDFRISTRLGTPPADSFAPITNTIGFLECGSPVEAANTFLSWQGPIYAKLGTVLRQQSLSGRLEALLPQLLPLTSVEKRRYLFVPTESRWVAFFDNGHAGTDAVSVISYLSKLIKCRGISATASTNIPSRTHGAAGQYGALMFELFAPDGPGIFNTVRSISLANDGGRWRFDLSGSAVEGENSDAYSEKRLRDRFSETRLDQLLRSFEIRAFEPDYYMPFPDSAAILIEKVGPIGANAREFDLHTIRKSRGLELGTNPGHRAPLAW